MTTNYPLGVILMELSCQLGLRRVCLRARRIPRLQNEEADALTNGDFQHFDPKHRIPVSLDQLQFRVLNELFEEGETYIAELEYLKKAEKEKRLRKVTDDAARSTFTRFRASWRGGELVRPLRPARMREMGDHGYFGQSSAVSPCGLDCSGLWIDMSACGSLTLDSAGLAVGVGFGMGRVCGDRIVRGVVCSGSLSGFSRREDPLWSIACTRVPSIHPH